MNISVPITDRNTKLRFKQELAILLSTAIYILLYLAPLYSFS